MSRGGFCKTATLMAMVLTSGSLLSSLLSTESAVPPKPAKRCGCEPASYSDTPGCEGDGRCIVLRNECIFPLWAVVTAGSPPTVFADVTLEPGESKPLSNLPDVMLAGRIYLYYRDPAEFGQGRYSIADDGPAPAVPPPSNDWAQLLEFSFLRQHKRGQIVDYDISYVDAVALPVVMQAHKPLAGRNTRGRTPDHCKVASSMCPPEQLAKFCPTEVRNRLPQLGVGQCVSSMKLCEGMFERGQTHPQCDSMQRYSDLSKHARGPGGCDVCGVLGCEESKFGTRQEQKERKGNGSMTPETCQAVHRGVCLGEAPFIAGKNCPPPGVTKADWFKGKAPHNEYSRWVRQIADNVFSFSYDDDVGHSQCTSPRLDIIVCPECANV